MSRPQLNRHLMLEQETQTADRAGGFLQDWTVVGAHWADIQPGSGRETSGRGASVSRVAFKITMRSAPIGSDARPKAGQRFRGHGQIYAIHAVSESSAGARYLTCTTTQETVA